MKTGIRERFFDIVLGVMLNVVCSIILLGSYIFLKKIALFLVLLIIFLPIFFFSTKLVCRSRERMLTLDDVQRKILKLKKRKFLALILGL
jgi:Na+/phosphate symporter